MLEIKSEAKLYLEISDDYTGEYIGNSNKRWVSVESLEKWANKKIDEVDNVENVQFALGICTTLKKLKVELKEGT